MHVRSECDGQRTRTIVAKSAHSSRQVNWAIEINCPIKTVSDVFLGTY